MFELIIIAALLIIAVPLVAGLMSGPTLLERFIADTKSGWNCGLLSHHIKDGRLRVVAGGEVNVLVTLAIDYGLKCSVNSEQFNGVTIVVIYK